MKQPIKPTHGGKRPGAGRKPGNPRQSLSIRISQPAMARLDELRETTGISAGKIVEAMILNHRPAPTRLPIGTNVSHPKHGNGVVFSYDNCDERSCGVEFNVAGQWCIAIDELTVF